MKEQRTGGVWKRFWASVADALHEDEGEIRREQVQLKLEALKKRVDAQQGDPRLTLTRERRHQ